MSTLPENELDLEKLFLPAWAQEAPSAAKYAHYEGEQERPDRRERRGPRPPRRDGGGPGGSRFGNRPAGDRRPPGPGGERDRQGQARSERRGRPQGEQRDQRERREPPPPLPEVDVSLVPEAKGVESLARQIKITGRAYPLFDIAQLILQKPERHQVVFSVMKNPEGQPVQPLFLCALDDTVWLSEDEAVGHVLRKHFDTFYQADRTATEPPKGKYTFVAQCGMSGVVLGPPNYHDYQNQLRKIHAERFSRMPFEVYKSRVKIVRDEEVVKKWVDDQSWKTEYICLNLPEPLRLGSMEAVEKHFRETHKENIIKPVESHTLNGAAARALRSPELTRLVRAVTEDQRRFPLQLATVLSQQFAAHGLQFFKVNKTITHVAVARPHYLDLSVIPVSDGVKRIVDYINAKPKCTRRGLVEALAPSPTRSAPPGEPPPESTEQAPAAATSASDAPTPEQTAVIADLHWLIHQGHVIEFANGVLECAKKPLPKPPKPEKSKPAEPATQPEAGAAAAQTAGGAAPVAEASPDAGQALEPSVPPEISGPTGQTIETAQPAGAADNAGTPSEPATAVTTDLPETQAPAAPRSEPPERPEASASDISMGQIEPGLAPVDEPAPELKKEEPERDQTTPPPPI